MGISKIPNIAFLVCILCASCQGHLPKISSSVISHAGLSIDRQRRPTLRKINDFHTSGPITPIYLQPPPLRIASASTDQHYQWWDNNNSPEIVQSGWYGFNRFTPRSARNIGNNSNRKARASYLLGESSQVQPQSFKRESQRPKQYNEDLAIHEVLRELQRHIHPLPQQQYAVEPRIVMIEDTFGLPPGLLVPVVHPLQQSSIPRFSSYRRPQKDLRRLASAPTPVTIKVVPLKITSVDIANALKSMSFVPIPMEFLKGEDKLSEGNVEISYDDKRSNEEDEEPDLPRPSSHVATPLDKPLGITYAEAQRTEHFISNYQPRK